MKTALVFGATGLVGRNLVKSLDLRDDIDSIKVFVRKEINFDSQKVSFFKFDSQNLNKEDLSGDELYLCLGTTIRKAGNIKNFQAVDLNLPLKIAELCKSNNIESVAVVSSIHANRKSKNYFLKTKGELEEKLINLHFDNLLILRPSLLLGKRDEFRFGESVMQGLSQTFNPLFKGKLKKYRGIKAARVAQVMANKLPQTTGLKRLESDEIKM